MDTREYEPAWMASICPVLRAYLDPVSVEEEELRLEAIRICRSLFSSALSCPDGLQALAEDAVFPAFPGMRRKSVRTCVYACMRVWGQ